MRGWESTEKLCEVGGVRYVASCRGGDWALLRNAAGKCEWLMGNMEFGESGAFDFRSFEELDGWFRENVLGVREVERMVVL